MVAQPKRPRSRAREAACALLYRTAMRAKIIAVVALTASLLAFAAGCGAVGPLAEKCQAACRKQLGCEGSIAGDCTDQCVAVNMRWRTEFSDEYFKCYLKGFSSACASDDSVCIDTAMSMLTSRPDDQTFTNTCYQTASSCMYKDFMGDRCNISRAYAQQYLDRARGCLSKPCDQINACLSDAFGG